LSLGGSHGSQPVWAPVGIGSDDHSGVYWGRCMTNGSESRGCCCGRFDRANGSIARDNFCCDPSNSCGAISNCSSARSDGVGGSLEDCRRDVSRIRR
jgi:hypothetical protein